MIEAEKKRIAEIANVLRSLAERCQATAGGIEQFPITWRAQLNILWTEVVVHKREIMDLIIGERRERTDDDDDEDDSAAGD